MKTRLLISLLLFVVLAASLSLQSCRNQTSQTEQNLALLATPDGSMNWGNQAQLLNDGEMPTDSLRRRGRQNRPRPASEQWIEYIWESPVHTNQIGLFLWDFHGELPLPPEYRIEYYDGDKSLPLSMMGHVATPAALNEKYYMYMWGEQVLNLSLHTSHAIIRDDLRGELTLTHSRFQNPVWNGINQ